MGDGEMGFPTLPLPLLQVSLADLVSDPSSMASRTQFQLVRASLFQLQHFLTSVQLQAAQHHSPLYYDPALRNCADVAVHSMTC